MIIYEEIYKKLEEIFTIENIKDALYQYYAISQNGIVEVLSYDHSGESERRHYFSRNDEISLHSIRLTKGYNGLSFFPYVVGVIVGNFHADPTTGTVIMEKYRAELIYNSDLELITIDYFHVQ